jgi:hypothetical protein
MNILSTISDIEIFARGRIILGQSLYQLTINKSAVIESGGVDFRVWCKVVI